MGTRSSQELYRLCNLVFPVSELLPEIPDWVKRAIGQRLTRDKITLVSAVCPDYEIKNGKFTYKAMGRDAPHTALQHLKLMKGACDALESLGVEVDYQMTLADTELDLPLVVNNLAGGSKDIFLEKCQESCRVLERQAERLGVRLLGCRRFTEAFSNWYCVYERARQVLEAEMSNSWALKHELNISSQSRLPLYKAMAGQQVGLDYCREMVVRQWAQYMTWGECAEGLYGSGLVMINHSTPNLGKVNYPKFRAGKQRIPILKLNISTMPE